MPYSLPPVSRRRFLMGSLAAVATLATAPELTRAAGVTLPSRATTRATNAAAAADPNRIALLSDLHIAANPAKRSRGVNMYENLVRAGHEILTSGPRPAAAIVTGDLSITAGKTGDYVTLGRALEPLRAGGLPLHLGLGNHDHFGRFRDAFPAALETRGGLTAKQVTVIETPRANLLLLDSLNKTNATAGKVGAEQTAWLARELDARRDKPAIVLVHHHPSDAIWNTGLTDTAMLFDAIVPRRQVKAVVFGHTHVWSASRHEGIHLVNLPPTAYTFGRSDPNGWTDLRLTDRGATFTLHALDKATHRNGETLDLTWRA